MELIALIAIILIIVGLGSINPFLGWGAGLLFLVMILSS